MFAGLLMATRADPNAVVAVPFGATAFFVQRQRRDNQEHFPVRHTSRHKAVITAFAVVFLAEQDDLTQILTANLAARYHSVL